MDLLVRVSQYFSQGVGWAESSSEGSTEEESDFKLLIGRIHFLVPVWQGIWIGFCLSCWQQVGCSSVVLLLLLLSRFSRVHLYATPETAAHQAPPSLGFSRQEQTTYASQRMSTVYYEGVSNKAGYYNKIAQSLLPPSSDLGTIQAIFQGHSNYLSQVNSGYSPFALTQKKTD